MINQLIQIFNSQLWFRHNAMASLLAISSRSFWHSTVDGNFLGSNQPLRRATCRGLPMIEAVEPQKIRCPLVNIKIAGIYGGHSPKNGINRYWSIPKYETWFKVKDDLRISEPNSNIEESPNWNHHGLHGSIGPVKSMGRLQNLQHFRGDVHVETGR